jgi:hypothetical protein
MAKKGIQDQAWIRRHHAAVKGWKTRRRNKRRALATFRQLRRDQC